MPSGDPPDELAATIDMIASEYGWSAEAIMDTPIDITPHYIHAILNRRGVRVFKRHFTKDESAPSLKDKLASIFSPIDTAGIV